MIKRVNKNTKKNPQKLKKKIKPRFLPLPSTVIFHWPGSCWFYIVEGHPSTLINTCGVSHG